MIMKGIYSDAIFCDAYAGQMPKFCVSRFMVAAQRARVLLQQRDVAELTPQIDSLMWMVDEVKPGYCNRDDTTDDIKTEELVTAASALYQQKDGFKLDDIGNLTWPEYFAVLAFMEIADAWLFESFTDNGKNLSHFSQSVYFSTLGHNAAAAVEAVCFGERILHETRLASGVDAKVKEQISLHAKRASIARHKKLSELKRQFFTYWRSGTFPSGAEAARRFYDSLPAEQQKQLSPLGKEHAVRTLCGALAEFKKAPNAS